MSTTIKIRRGAVAGIPTGADGEPLFTTDTKKLYIGYSGANYQIGAGTVTSVAMSVPTELSVAGSPITSSGTLALTWGSASGNKVIGSPADGSSGAYAGRALVSADIPSLAASKITSGQLALARGGTGLDASGVTDGQLLIGKTSDNTLNLATLTAGTGISVTNGAGSITIAATGGAGTVTSVGLSTDASWLTVGSTPVTSSGTITLNKTTGLTANQVLATPDGSTGVVGLRALVSADLPTVGVAKGGTNLTSYTVGDLLYATGSTTLAKLAVGTAGQALICNATPAPSWQSPTTCRVYNSGVITLTTGVAAVLTFDSERFDSASLHNTASNTSRIVAVSVGKWLVGCCLDFAPNATGFRQAYIRLNGTTVIAASLQAAVSGVNVQMAFSTIYETTVATDYFEVIAFQNSGGNLNISASGHYSPEFWAIYLGP